MERGARQEEDGKSEGVTAGDKLGSMEVREKRILKCSLRK